MRRLALAALGLIALVLPALSADNATLITPCASGCVTVRARDVGAGVQSMIQIPGDTAGNALATAPGVANASFALPVQGVAGGVAMPVLLNAETTKVIGTVNQGTSPWVVSNGGTFAVQAAQTGAWNITNITGTISLPTGAATAAKQPALGIAGTASADIISVQGIAAMTPLLVNPGTAASWGIGATGAAVPANAQYIAINSGGNLVGWTGAVTNAGTFAVQAAQATAANLNATVVGTGTFAVQATLQASAATAIGTVNPNTIASWGLVAASQNAAPPTNSMLGACQFTTTPTTIVSPNVSPLQCDNANNLLVDIKAGTVAATQSGTWNIGTVSSITNALPAGTNVIGHVIADTGSTTAATQATAANLNATVVGTGTFAVQATLQASAATAIGTVNPNTIASWGLLSGTTPGTPPTNTMIVGGKYNTAAPAPTNGQTLPLQQDSAGNLYVNVAAGGASGGTSSTFGAAFPGTGTAAGMSQGGNMVAMTGTTGNLNVQCANCSGSGVSTVDEAAFTGGASAFVGTGGFFQTTATNNALTTGQQGMFQVTANRALFSNLRNAAGTEVGTAATPLQVSVANTAANGTAMLVTGTGGTFPATLSAETTKVIGTVRNLGNAGAITDFVGQAATAPANAWLVGATFFTTPTTLTNGQASPLQIDSAGNLLVNIKAGASSGAVAQGSTTSGQTGGLTQAAVTTSAPTYTTGQTNPLSLDTAGNLRVNVTTATGLAQGSTTSGQSGSMVMGAVTTSSPSYTTAQTSPLSLDTSGNLRVNVVAGGAGGGAVFGPTAVGSAAANPPVLIAGTANAGATGNVQVAKVTSGGVLSADVSTVNGVTTLTGTGAVGTGSQRIAVGTDTATIAGSAPGTAGASSANVVSVQGIASGTNLPVSQATAANLNATVVGTGTFVTQSTLAAETTKVIGTVNQGTSPWVISGSLTANQSVNVAQINGVTPLMGNGVTGTGSQRVTIASDNTAFAVNATLSAETTKVIGTTRTLGNAGAIVDFVGQAASAPANAWLVGATFFTTPTTLTNGQASPLQIDSAGNLLVNIKAGGGAGGTSIADKAAWTVSSTVFTLSGGQFTTGGATACTTGQACTVGMTAARAFMTDNSSVAGTATLTGNGVTGAGSQRVTIASDNTAFAVNATLSAETTKVIGTVNQGTSPWVISGSLTANQSVNVAQINGVTPLMGNGVTGTGSQRVTIASDNTAFAVKIDQTTPGTTNAVSLAQIGANTVSTGNGIAGTGVQRVTIASDNTAFAVNATLSAETTKVIGTVNQGTSPWVISGALTANQSVNVAQIGGTNVVNGGVAGSQSVGGTVATNVAITANPVNLGAQAISSENTAVTTARQVQLVADLVGKLIVLPYANPENFVSGTTAAMTGTTTTSLIAAPAAGLRNYLTHIVCTNSHATVGTFVVVQDGSGGTTIYEGYAAAVGGGFSLTLPTPLRQPTTATALFVADVTTGANVICSASGYKGA